MHAVARLVPPGRVTSYGAIARYPGPHRGLRPDGCQPRRHHAAPRGMRVADDAVTDFERLFWNPATELP
ncbi:hypothetical protein [Hymenobacter coccineus]|uniref:hypothetical protein n=1 Tax=Hymenobacter coccineus TaxID=1908235 RepID=UPI000A5F200E|nr:hypothetical protein [Hymenobacter coccineus]